MKFKRTIEIERGHLDIAPLIDVIFLLLIFFMLTSSFIFQPGIRVNLPKAVTSEVLHRELLVIVVTAGNEVYVNERPVDNEELFSRISLAARENQPLLIKADKKANLGKVIEIWDLCRQVEVKQVNIATTQ
ncbi:MAG: biopolymer transporter ExbD [Candidatus Omnitrophica bacterium]|nr:biopolymer transporter ExbD [Candidatus Omnitrophota bacterium]MBU1127499.1 biopolymer transporter ExbD [Candidatus Omnitrophota bacterium]MBU1785123.1 biopolymer transporter ExbD [Candidatus Omnitrophota bacterium]MBU1851516.1 biopolymer transporter ExbD [Candidatus Omnitrophota bacterium]